MDCCILTVIYRRASAEERFDATLSWTDMMKADQQMDEPKSRRRRHSPAASVSSSQQDVRTGSSMSTSGSSEPTDVASPVIHNRTALPPTMPDNAEVHFFFCCPRLFGQ